MDPHRSAHDDPHYHEWQRSKSMDTAQERVDFMAWVSRSARGQRRLKRLGADVDWLRDQMRRYGADPVDLWKLL